MTGRIKWKPNRPSRHNHLKPRPKPHPAFLLPRQDAAPIEDSPETGSSLFENQNPAETNNGFVLNKQTITWLVVISVIVVATLIIVSVLLCKCKRRRIGKQIRHANGHRWHPSLEVKDGRNEFPAWNRHAPPRPSIAEERGLRMDTFESGDSVAPLVRPTAAAARVSSANGNAVMEPVVVDYAQPGTGSAKKNSRYYSNLSSGRGSIWKRISQIGRAY